MNIPNFLTGCLCLIASVSIHASPSQSLVAVTEERGLLQYQQDGVAKGPSVDIFNMLMMEAKLSAKIEFYPWKRAFNKSLREDNTLIFSIARIKEREDKFHWLLKVSDFIRTFVYKKGTQPVVSFEQARGKTISVVRGSIGHQVLVKNGFNKELYIVTSLEESIALFDSGRVDLLYTDPNSVKNYYIARNLTFDEKIDFSIPPGARKSSYIAIRKEASETLVQRLQRAADIVREKEAYKILLNYRPLLSKDSN